MPTSRFFFDCTSNDVEHVDAFGIELRRDQVGNEAHELACIIFGEMKTSGRSSSVTIKVRSKEGKVIYLARASFEEREVS